MFNTLTNSGFSAWSDNVVQFKFCCFCGRRWQTFFIIAGEKTVIKYYVNQEEMLPFSETKCPVCNGTLVDYKSLELVELIVK